MTIFLLISGFAAAVDPRPLRGPTRAPSTTTAPTASTERPQAQARAVRLDASGRAERRVRAGAHVVLTVEVEEPGDVAIEGLDLLTPASPEAPAVFDLLAGRPGRYPVLFTPTGGGAKDIGALLVTGR